MATVQTLKDKNNDTFYPVTKTEAVYNADGSETLDNTLNTKATISTSAGDANKMMKADGTKALVGSSNIDWTTLDTGWVHLVNQTNFYVRYRKIGKVVYVWGRSGNAKNIPADSTFTSLATLPEGCRPSVETTGFVSLLGGNQSASRFLDINTDGTISIYNRSGDSAFTYWSFNESFPVD